MTKLNLLARSFLLTSSLFAAEQNFPEQPILEGSRLNNGINIVPFMYVPNGSRIDYVNFFSQIFPGMNQPEDLPHAMEALEILRVTEQYKPQTEEKKQDWLSWKVKIKAYQEEKKQLLEKFNEHQNHKTPAEISIEDLKNSIYTHWIVFRSVEDKKFFESFDANKAKKKSIEAKLLQNQAKKKRTVDIVDKDLMREKVKEALDILQKLLVHRDSLCDTFPGEFVGKPGTHISFGYANQNDLLFDDEFPIIVNLPGIEVKNIKSIFSSYSTCTSVLSAIWYDIFVLNFLKHMTFNAERNTEVNLATASFVSELYIERGFGCFKPEDIFEIIIRIKKNVQESWLSIFAKVEELLGQWAGIPKEVLADDYGGGFNVSPPQIIKATEIFSKKITDDITRYRKYKEQIEYISYLRSFIDTLRGNRFRHLESISPQILNILRFFVSATNSQTKKPEVFEQNCLRLLLKSQDREKVIKVAFVAFIGDDCGSQTYFASSILDNRNRSLSSEVLLERMISLAPIYGMDLNGLYLFFVASSAGDEVGEWFLRYLDRLLFKLLKNYDSPESQSSSQDLISSISSSSDKREFYAQSILQRLNEAAEMFYKQIAILSNTYIDGKNGANFENLVTSLILNAKQKAWSDEIKSRLPEIQENIEKYQELESKGELDKEQTAEPISTDKKKKKKKKKATAQTSDSSQAIQEQLEKAKQELKEAQQLVEEFKSKKDEIEKRLQTLEATKNKKIESVVYERNSTTQELAKTKQALERANTSIQDLKGKMAELEKSKENNSQRYRILQQTNNDLTSQVREFTEEKKQLLNQRKSMISRLKSREEEIESKTDELAQSKEIIKKRDAELQLSFKKYEQLQQELALQKAAKTELSEKDNEIEMLKKQLEEERKSHHETKKKEAALEMALMDPDMALTELVQKLTGTEIPFGQLGDLDAMSNWVKQIMFLQFLTAQKNEMK